jgi:hypothetical protein
MDDPFETSRRKLARAKEHIQNFGERMRSFLQSNPYRKVINPDPQRPEHDIHKIRFSKGLPDSLISSAADAIHNLRSALDGAVYGLAAGCGKVHPRYAAFPFSRSAVEFENNLKGGCKDVPKEIYPFFRALKPYKGGNDTLWSLNEVSNIDKHALLSIGLGSKLAGVTGKGGLVRMLVNPAWDRLKNEIELGTFVRGSGVQYKAKIALFIGFSEPEAIAGQPALRVLDECASEVERVVLALEVEARRLGYIC